MSVRNPCFAFIETSFLETLRFQPGEERKAARRRYHLLDFSHSRCYHVRYETETSVQVQVLPNRRATTGVGSDVWLCTLRLQLGAALANRCLLSASATHRLP